jgi:hypothetical protein
MIIKVDREEKGILEYVAAVYGLQCHIFTMENNPMLFQAEVLHADGGQIDAEMGWLLCKSVHHKLERA